MPAKKKKKGSKKTPCGDAVTVNGAREFSLPLTIKIKGGETIRIAGEQTVSRRRG